MIQKITLFFILSIGLFFSCTENKPKAKESSIDIVISNYIGLNGKWHLYIGDDIKVKNTYYKLSKLNTITMPGRYKKQGYSNIKGYSWLIKEFNIIKFPLKNLGIYLGEIKSIDETYLNGKLIGKTGSVHPQLVQAFDRKRIYSIPIHILRKGKNRIAIRIYSPQERGGIKVDNIYIDDYSKLIKSENMRLFFLGIVAVISIFVGFSFIMIYRYFSEFRESFFFGLMSIFLGFYLIFSDQLKYFISDSFFIMKKIEYLVMFPIPMFYLHFIFNLTNSKKNIMRPILFYMGLLFIGLAFVSPTIIWLLTILRFWQVYFVFGIIFGIILHVKKWNTLERDFKYFLMAYFATALFSFVDLTRSLGYHTYPKVLSLGVFFSLLGISIVLSIRYKNIFLSVKEQYSNLINIVESSADVSNAKQLAQQLYKLFLLRFKSNNFVYYIIDENKEYKYSSNKQWKTIGERINQLKLKDEVISKINVISQRLSLPFNKNNIVNDFYYFPLKINKGSRGFIAGAYKSIHNNDAFLSIIKILHYDVTTMLKSFDYKNDLEKLNRNLEKTVKERTSQVRKKNRELKKLNKIKSEFFANITHDIKTPLSLMSISIESLLQKNKEASDTMPPKSITYLEKIKHNTYRVILMINSLLDSAKIESGNSDVHLVYADISHFIKSISELYEEIVEKLDMQFIVNLPEEPIYTAFDYEKFEKIINNLLSNAIKFNLKGKSIIINLFLKNKNTYVLSIIDHGKGISKGELSEVFERYKQKRDVAGISKMGIGLGLSIVKDFVNMHKGRVSVTSKLGDQTEFKLIMPILKQKNKHDNFLNNHINSLYVTNQNREKLISEINRNQKSLSYNTDSINLCISSQIFNEIMYNYSDFFEEYTKIQLKTISDIQKYIRSLQRSQTNLNFHVFILENKSKRLSEKYKKIIKELNQLFIPIIVIDKNNKLDFSNYKNLFIDEVIHPPYYPAELKYKLSLLESQKRFRKFMNFSSFSKV